MLNQVSWHEGSGESKDVEEATAELEDVERKTEDTRLATLQTTRRMVQLFNDCEDAGIATLSLLHHQREQLNRTESKLDGIGVDLEKAENTLIQIEKEEKACCFCCPFLPWKVRRKYSTRKSAIWLPKTYSTEVSPSSLDPLAATTMNEMMKDAPTDPNSVGNPTRKTTTTLTASKWASMKKSVSKGAARKSSEFIEEEISDNMEEISSVVKSLKKAARDMEGELIHSNAQLDRINAKAESNVRRVSTLTKYTKKVHDMEDSESTWFLCRSCWFSNKFATAGAITKL